MIRRMTKEDIEEVLPYVREQESTTIERLGIDPRRVLASGLGDYAFAGVTPGGVCCLWGIAFAPNIGVFPRLWLVTTPLIEKHKMEFLRESRKFVLWASREFGVLEGCVDVANEVSKKWLGWLGFRPAESLGQYIRMIHDGH